MNLPPEPPRLSDTRDRVMAHKWDSHLGAYDLELMANRAKAVREAIAALRQPAEPHLTQETFVSLHQQLAIAREQASAWREKFLEETERLANLAAQPSEADILRVWEVTYPTSADFKAALHALYHRETRPVDPEEHAG